MALRVMLNPCKPESLGNEELWEWKCSGQPVMFVGTDLGLPFSSLQRAAPLSRQCWNRAVMPKDPAGSLWDSRGSRLQPSSWVWMFVCFLISQAGHLPSSYLICPFLQPSVLIKSLLALLPSQLPFPQTPDTRSSC